MTSETQNKLKYRVGNLIDLAFAGKYDMIIHGCNIFHTFGSGIAKEIAERIPALYDVDKMTTYGDVRKLGTYSLIMCVQDELDFKPPINFLGVNLYTQGSYGRSGVHVDYGAIERGLYQLAQLNRIHSEFSDQPIRVGIPKIGAGLGGGDWERIEAIIVKSGFPDIECVVLDESQIPEDREVLA